MTFQTTVTDPSGKPIDCWVGASVQETGNLFARNTDGNGYADLDVKDTPVGSHITFLIGGGYVIKNPQYGEVTGANQAIHMVAKSFRRPAGGPRHPLSAFDTDAFDPESPFPLCQIHTTLPKAIDPTRRLDYWRGDAWGLTLPGLPVIPRGSSRNPERLLTYLLHAYPTEWQDIALDTYAQWYTHWLLSWPDARGMGVSVEEYLALTQRVKDRGLYVAHMLTSKDFDPADADVDTRIAGVEAVVDGLLAANLMDIPCIGWELDLFNDPHYLQDFIEAVCASCQRPLAVHFSSYKTAWQFDGEPRAAFYDRNRGQIGWLLYQTDPRQPVAVMQAHFQDAMIPASGLAANGVQLVAFEVVAALQFDGDTTEETGNLANYELLCTPGPMPVSGFGNGARYPDGTTI